MSGLYIHIPFCKSRCIYCDFYSTTLGSEVMEKYLDALCKELTTSPHLPSPIQTIYLGGGTPSQLPPTLLRKLLLYIYKVREVDDNAEVTIECNPDDITPAYAEAIAQLPINRVSMGVQTFDDDRLQWLHRRHSSSQVVEAVHLLRQAGLRNISIDLMFGFPDQTLEQWEKDLRHAIRLHVEHISSYSLMVEPGTSLHQMLLKEGLADFEERNSDVSRAMYESLIDHLTAAGFEHYEISNFARYATEKDKQMNAACAGSSFRSRHNSSYWQNIPYLGIGAAAHSYDGRRRWWNKDDVVQYIHDIEAGDSPIEETELLDKRTQYNDLITTAIRTREGINLEELKSKYGQHYEDYIMKNAASHLKRRTLAIDNHHLHLTRQGLFVSDDIMSDLVYI